MGILRSTLRIATLVLALATATLAHAIEIPPLRGHVVDRADLLPPDREAALERRLASFESTKGVQILVHTTPSLEGLDIESYSIEIAEAWKAGRAKVDDGVILTIAPNERKARIEVGYGLEGAIPDALASRIIQEDILPAFRAESYALGIERGVDSLVRLASGESLPPPRRRSAPQVGSPLFTFLFIVAFIVLALLQGGSRGRRRHWGSHGFPGGHPSRRGGFGGGFPMGGGGFGGGFSGGGGRFGGGGASGSW